MKQFNIILTGNGQCYEGQQWARSEMELRIMLCEVIHVPFEIVSIEEVHLVSQTG